MAVLAQFLNRRSLVRFQSPLHRKCLKIWPLLHRSEGCCWVSRDSFRCEKLRGATCGLMFQKIERMSIRLPGEGRCCVPALCPSAAGTDTMSENSKEEESMHRSLRYIALSTLVGTLL